jgi:hypothetical protein
METLLKFDPGVRAIVSSGTPTIWFDPTIKRTAFAERLSKPDEIAGFFPCDRLIVERRPPDFQSAQLG